MIDLKRLASDKYRVELDPSADDSPRDERPWLWRITCKYGFVGVHGPDTLLAHCNAARVIARLLAVPDVAPRQIGGGEVNCSFPPDRLDAVAEVLGARRRRRLSEEQRERLVAAGQAGRFSRRT
jgi:hypothetical protein